MKFSFTASREIEAGDIELPDVDGFQDITLETERNACQNSDFRRTDSDPRELKAVGEPAEPAGQCSKIDGRRFIDSPVRGAKADSADDKATDLEVGCDDSTRTKRHRGWKNVSDIVLLLLNIFASSAISWLLAYGSLHPFSLVGRIAKIGRYYISENLLSSSGFFFRLA